MGNIEIKKKSTVNAFRQTAFFTTIPKIIVETANIRKGQKILWRYDGNKIVVELLEEGSK